MSHLRAFPVLVLVLLAGCRTTTTQTYGWPEDLKAQTSLGAGYRSVDHPVFEDHAYASVELSGYRVGAPAGLELGASFATEDAELGGSDVDGRFSEGYLGLRKTFGSEGDALRPFVSMGGQYMRIVREPAAGGPSADEWSGGGYLRAGVYWSLGRLAIDGGTEFLIGFDVRAVASEDADFVQGGLFLGFGR